MRIGGRAAICGMISGYGSPPQPGPGNLTQLIVKRLRFQGFLVLDHLHRRGPFEEEVLPLVEDGTLHSEVTIWALAVARRDLSRTELFEGAVPQISEGEALLRVDRVGVTANNVTYAVLGESFHYWDFFPADPAWALGWCRRPAT